MDSDEPSSEGTRPSRELDERLGRAFRRLREQRSLSQKKAGEGLGYTQQWLQKIEAGRSVVSVETFLTCCRFYEVEPRTLLPDSWTGSSPSGFAEQHAGFEPAPPFLSSDDEQMLAAYRAIRNPKLKASALHVLQALT